MPSASIGAWRGRVGWVALGLAAASIALQLIGFWWGSGPRSGADERGSGGRLALLERTRELEADLAAERFERQILEQRLDGLVAKLEASDGDLLSVASAASVASVASPEAEPWGEAEASDTSSFAANDAVPRPVERSGTVQQRGLDEALLVGAGFSPSEARELRAVYEEIQMEQLYLRDRASREGWKLDGRLSESLTELAVREREQASRLGDEAYDWMLYATGRPNRVRVRQVFGDSPAADAGIAAGDVVLRYGDQRIRNAQDLRSATSDGKSGEWMDVDFLRDGKPMHTRVPRGPLGVMLDLESTAPAPDTPPGP